MHHGALRIIGLMLLSAAIAAGAAWAQNNVPAPPSAPGAPSTQAAPTPPPSDPNTAVPSPYALNVAFAGDNRLVLTDAQGMTMYYMMNDMGVTRRCTGTCTAVWLPATAASGTAANPALSPTTVVSGPDGPQLAYHGHLLYRYSKDTAPGQLNGDRIADTWGVWAAATADLPSRP
jgi:predicted lipoprotein with Yx(FWY)xxD motif